MHFKYFKISFKMHMVWQGVAERLFARLFHRITLSIHNRNYQLFACCIQSFFALNFARFHEIRLRTKSGKVQIRVVNEFPRSRHQMPFSMTSSSIQKWLWPGLSAKASSSKQAICNTGLKWKNNALSKHTTPSGLNWGNNY